MQSLLFYYGKALLHIETAMQKASGMENIPVTSVCSKDSSGVKLEYVVNASEVTGAQMEPSANLSSQSSINTFTFSGKSLLCY